MNKNLYVVESPTKANIIKSYGNQAIYTHGHITEIDHIDFIKNNKIKVNRKRKNYSKIEEEIKKAQGKIVIGTDNDIEGEAIAYVIAQIAEKYNKEYIRSPLYGISNKKISDFIYVKTARKINMNMVYSAFSRASIDAILNKVFYQIIEKEIGNNIYIGRIQHIILQLLNQFKNYNIYTIGNYRFISKFKISHFETKIIKDAIIRPPLPFNTASVFMDSVNMLDLDISTTAQALQALYNEGYITYPRTDGVALEEESYIKLFVKASEIYKLNKLKYIIETQPAISPLLIEKKFVGNINKVFNLIMRRTIASMLQPYPTSSIKYNIVFENGKEKYINMFKDDKNIISSIYIPDYILPESENEYKPYYLGNGLSEYEIVKFLKMFQLAKPSTLAYIINKMIKKGFISKNFMDTFELTALGKEINKVLASIMGFLDIKFYQMLNKDIEYIAMGIQHFEFPILKLQNELKKIGIRDVDTIDFQFDKNNEEIMYKLLWVDTDEKDKKEILNLKYQ